MPSATPHHTDAPASPSLALIELLIAEHRARTLPRLRQLWDYYRNPARTSDASSPQLNVASLAQTDGLPPRFTGTDHGDPFRGRGHFRGRFRGGRDVVIENDIAWRVHTLVDFMFGRPLTMQSNAPDPQRAAAIESFLHSVFAANGGAVFYQDLALLGSVYGYVDVLVHAGAGVGNRAAASSDPAAAGRQVVLELIEAPRAIPVLDPGDYRRLEAYILNYRQTLNRVAAAPLWSRLRDRLRGDEQQGAREVVERTVVHTADAVSIYRGERGRRRLVERVINPLGRLPIVHIQNLPQPFFYEGLSEVEPLIPLQDELNTRLCDRANRVTFQSFKMYLGKGIERFGEQPIGPGQMWTTDNLQASIEEFGGDASSPSEAAHIIEVREALDKTSSVTPIAAGVIRDRVGNLTSENALRVVMMGLLARTEKKRLTYGSGIEKLCELVLDAADTAGLFATTPEERSVRLDWPSPLPEYQTQRLKDAQLKLELGVPREQVLTELGYGDCVGEPG